MFKIIRQVPRQIVFDAYNAIFCNCNNDRYFHNSIMSNVPKQMNEKKIELDILKASYCANETYTVTEQGQPTPKGVAQILNAWVKEYDTPRVLNKRAICR